MKNNDQFQIQDNDQFQIYDRRQWQDLPPQNKKAWNNFYMTHAGQEITDTMSYRAAQNHKKFWWWKKQQKTIILCKMIPY